MELGKPEYLLLFEPPTLKEQYEEVDSILFDYLYFGKFRKYSKRKKEEIIMNKYGVKKLEDIIITPELEERHAQYLKDNIGYWDREPFYAWKNKI